MLVLTRQEGETVTIGNEIIVTVLRVYSESITVSIDSLFEAAATTSHVRESRRLAVDPSSDSRIHPGIFNV